MRRKHTLVIWHATMFVACMLLASQLGLIGFFAWGVLVWGCAHGAEFLYFGHNYRYIPIRRDYIPIMFFCHLGCVGMKLTSFFYFDFYKLWGGEIRCYCRWNNRRYTLLEPGFFGVKSRFVSWLPLSGHKRR